jgi:hypothetical protein
MTDFRRRLWLNIMEDLGPPEGCIVPVYLLCVYAVLFPLHGLRVLLDRASGFDFTRLVWTIHGLEISDLMLMQLAAAQGQVYRVVTVNGVVTLHRLMPGVEGGND